MRVSTTSLALVGLCFFWGTGSFVLAQSEIAKLTASDAAAGDSFGIQAVIDGDVAVVGATNDDGQRGAAYVYRHNGTSWVEEQKLTASDAAPGDVFGQGLSVMGDVILVGAQRDDDTGADSGSVYVFVYDGFNWVEEQKLTASDGAAGGAFGLRIGLRENLAVIGADKIAGGSAYVFRYEGANWIEEQKLTASDSSPGDRFGFAVSVDGDTAIIGAFEDDSNTGSAYVFAYDGSNWAQEQKLTASDGYPGTPGHGFGVTISLNDGVALIAATTDNHAGLVSGSAYIFRNNDTSWIEEQKLTASDAAPGDTFGFSLALGEGVALVAAYLDDAGSVYVFRHDGLTWVEETKLTASDGASGDNFGYSLSTSEDRAIVGAIADDSNRGSAYVFLFEGDEDGDGVPDADDGCPTSDTSPTVVIDGCDSQVTNHVLDDGCTIADLIAECAAGAQNHGQFVSCVAELTNSLKRDGVITGLEKGAIQSCAAQADIP